ncbi:MAG TPA: hypothetical protein VL137_12965 [Polyangiaceae bacterium]|nr:hypothetical protein [Polyangiaceae bacterium]
MSEPGPQDPAPQDPGPAPAAMTEPSAPSAPLPTENASDESSGDSPERLTHWIVTLLIGLSALMVLFHLQDSSLTNANTGSRYATIESIVDYHSYYIDKSQYRNTIDKFQFGDHLLSSKPPALPTYAAGVYWVYEKLTGKTIVSNEGEVVWLVSLFTGWLAHVVFLIYLYRFCQLLLKRQLAIILCVAAGAFAYLGAAYATALNNHSIGGAMGFVGFYYAFRIRNQLQVRTRHWIFAGLCLGFLPAVDLPSLALSGCVSLYLLSYDWKKTLLLFAPCLLPGLVVQLGLSVLTTGSLMPAYGNAELKTFSGNYFRQIKSGIDALHEPKYVYAFNALIGHHGLFSMTPLFGFSLWEMIRHWKRRDRYLPELAVVTATTLAVIVFYLWRTHNYGGWCVGMRWFVPFMPLLLLYFGLWLDRAKLSRSTWAWVLAAFLVSAFNVQDGLTSPFQFSMWNNWLEGTPNLNRIGPKMNLRRGNKPKKPRAQ